MNLETAINGRNELNKTIRTFWEERGFLEVETPFLVSSPDLSPVLDHFETTQRFPTHDSSDSSTLTLALITSPEFSMKKLLGQGLQKIFTLARVFRNGEADTGQHRREFTMLEWYEQGVDYVVGMDQTEALIRACLADSNFQLPTSPIDRIHLPTRFFETTGIDYADASMEQMRSACERLGLTTDASDTWSDLFHRVFVTHIEPALPSAAFVYDFPKQQAALAALTLDGKYAQRFELYVGGLELCNAFTELTDPVEQRARFEEELLERKRLGKPAFPIDEALLAALPSLRKPTFGNAIGVDRLLMLKLGIKSIEELV